LWENGNAESIGKPAPTIQQQGANVGLAVSVREGITPEHLADVYADPFIARISHDGRAHSPVNHPLATYLTATVEDVFAGAFLAIRTSNLEIDLHALLKPAFHRHSRALGAAFIEWAFAQPGVERVSANICEGLESVRNYCLKLGFVQEGFKRRAFSKNGAIGGVYMMGLTRPDWGK
jgi:hypothetical protein